MVNAEFFDALEQLEKEKGIPVCNVPAYGTASVRR